MIATSVTLFAMNQTPAAQLRIGELAKEFRLNPKTIRYYEHIGLLPAPRRTPGGYRLYGHADQDRLRFIVRAKEIGLTLQEIGEILALRGGGQCPCDHVLEMIDQKLTAIDGQLRALHDVQQDLLAVREEASTAPQTGAQICAIIEHHDTADRSS